jgi:hypothetical protein
MHIFRLQLRGGTSENVENRVQEKKWILFKTQNFYTFLRYIVAPSKCEFGNYIKCAL